MPPQGWLFPGRDPVNPLTTRQLNRAVHAAAKAAGINKRVTPHTLPRSFARADRARDAAQRLQGSDAWK